MPPTENYNIWTKIFHDTATIDHEKVWTQGPWTNQTTAKDHRFKYIKIWYFEAFVVLSGLGHNHKKAQTVSDLDHHIVIFQKWRSSCRSRLPHRRAHCSTVQKSTPTVGYEAKAQSCSRVHIVNCDYQSLVMSVLNNPRVITMFLALWIVSPF